jgi:hypothetical protein
MRKIFLLTLFIASLNLTFTQFSITAGSTILKPFGIQGTHFGFNLSGEFAVDDLSTYYARLTFLPSKTVSSSSILVSGKDFDVNPFSIEVDTYEKLNYSILEFGKRYYFGEGYENGFAAYGGSSLNIIFNKVSLEIDEFDETKYQTTFSSENTGTIATMGFGLNGGIKNSFNFGTLSFDAGMNYSLFGIASNSVAQNFNNVSSLYFVFNLGFRKYLY